MKKKNNSWIAAGLFTIATGIATIYSLLEYRESVLIMGITSLLLLLSAFWLFTSISRLLKKEPEVSVGQEQRERMNYEGMKLQGEELIRLMNTFGKGTYAYSKRSAENLQAILEFTIQTQTSNERLLSDLIQNQTKTAKFQVKYGQEDTAKLIQTFAEQCRQLNDNLIKCADKIENQKIEIAAQQPDINVAGSLNDLSLELAHINTSIQALQLQLATVSQPSIVYAQNPQTPMPSLQDAAEKTTVPENMFHVDEPSTTDIPSAIEEVPEQKDTILSEEAEATDIEESVVIEETADAEEPLVIEEAADTEELVVVEEIADMEETADMEEPVSTEEVVDTELPANVIEFTASEQTDSTEENKDIAESEIVSPLSESEEVEETDSVEEAVAEEPVITPPSDNPNKQLSADEIAALFASLG